MSLLAGRTQGGISRARIPWLLVIGEILLGLAIYRYAVSFIIGTISDWDEVVGSVMTLLGLLFNLAMILLNVDSVIGIASAKPSSWRKAMRSSVILASISILYDILEWLGIDSGFIAFQNEFILPPVVATILIMMLPSVRRFYTPPLAEMPPLRSWVAYIFFWPLMPSGSYRFVYGEDAESPSS